VAFQSGDESNGLTAEVHQSSHGVIYGLCIEQSEFAHLLNDDPLRGSAPHLRSFASM
jgi:hypothetical protein